MSPVPYADALLPDFDVESVHEVHVAAPSGRVYPVARELDLSGSRLVWLLFRVRGLPASALRAEGLEKLRFKPLVEDPPRGFALGIVGRFWTPGGGLVDFDPTRFAELELPGHAKALWSFDLEDSGAGTTRVRTVTRVRCADAAARRWFGVYWGAVAPFSGMIRRRHLDAVRLEAEAGWGRPAD